MNSESIRDVTWNCVHDMLDDPVWDDIHMSVRGDTLDAVYDVIYVSLYENVNNSIRDFMTDYEFI